MKRARGILVAALLLALVATPGMAQNLSAGIQGGINISDLSIDDPTEDVDLDTSLGFSGGAFLAIDLHEYFRLQFAGQYVQKGAETEEDLDGVGTIEFDLAYIELMVPATLTIPIENSPITPRLFVAPAIAIETSCKLKAEVSGASLDVDCDAFDIDGAGLETKSIDFGAVFGGGLDIMVGNGAITLDALYNLGLVNINDTPGVGAEDVSIKNRNIQFLAGYRFFFGR